MPDFKKNFRPGGAHRTFTSGKQGFGQRGRSFEKKEMYDAECNKCHKPTQVPFRPNGKKPVYCRDCFVPEAGQERTQRFERRPAQSRPEFAPRAEKDPRIDDILHRLDSMERTLETLASHLEAMTRKEALADEVRKHIPAEAKSAPKKATAKKTTKAKKA